MRGEARVVRQASIAVLADRREKASPVLVVVDQHAEHAVGRGVGLAVGREQARVAGFAQRRLEGEARHVVAQHELRHGLEHRHDHGLAPSRLLAGVERRRHGIHRVQPGHPVRQRGGRIRRLRRAVALHEPGNAGGALDQVVVGRTRGVRPVLVEAAAAHVDDAGIARAHRPVIQPQPGQRLRPHIADEHVAALGQPQRRLAPVRVLQVQRDALLARVRMQKDVPHARVPHRSHVPHVVPLGRLHLHHLRTQLREDLRGERPHDHRGEIEHPHPRQRAGAWWGGSERRSFCHLVFR